MHPPRLFPCYPRCPVYRSSEYKDAISTATPLEQQADAAFKAAIATDPRLHTAAYTPQPPS